MMRLINVTLFAIATITTFEMKPASGTLESRLNWLDKVLASYDGNVRPNATSDPVIVEIDYYIINIVENEASKELALNFYFRLHWRDDRLKNKDSIYIMYAPQKYIGAFWKPDVFFPLARSVKFEKEPSANQALRLTSEGEIMFSRRLLITMPCKFDDSKFPYGLIECTSDIESYAAPMQDVTLKWKRIKPPRYEHLEQEGSSFVLRNISQIEKVEYLATGQYQSMQLMITLERDGKNFVVLYHLPYIFLVIVSYASLWIDRHAIFSRFILLFSSLIAMVAHSICNNFNNQSPAYKTGVEIYGSFCYVLLFLALVESAIVTAGHQKNIGKAGAEILESTRLHPDNGIPDEQKSFRSNKNGANWMKRLDCAARISYLVVFAIFNLGYWLGYAL